MRRKTFLINCRSIFSTPDASGSGIRPHDSPQTRFSIIRAARSCILDSALPAYRTPFSALTTHQSIQLGNQPEMGSYIMGSNRATAMMGHLHAYSRVLHRIRIAHTLWPLRAKVDGSRLEGAVARQNHLAPARLTALCCIALLHRYSPHRVVIGFLSSVSRRIEGRDRQQIRPNSKIWVSACLTAVCCFELPLLALEGTGLWDLSPKVSQCEAQLTAASHISHFGAALCLPKSQ